MYKRRVRLGDVLKRAVLISVVTVGAVALGAKFLAGYRVRAVLDDAVQKTSLFGDLRYLDVATSMDGKIHIAGLSFYPNEAIDMDPLIADEAVILTPGILFLLGLEGGPIPRRMGISLLGMWVDLASLSGLGGISGGSLSGNPFESVACGDVDSFQAPDLKKMGYSPNLRMDLHIRYELTGEQLSVTIEQSSLDLSGFALDFDVTAPGLAINPLNASAEDYRLMRLRLQLSASEFNRKRNAFCAENIGVSEEEFVERNTQAALAQLGRRGIEPSEVLAQHYEAFVSGEGEWTLETRPEPPVALTDIPAFEVDQMMEWLKMSSTIAGQPSALVSFKHFELVQESDEGEDPNADEFTTTVDQRIVLAQRSDPWVVYPLSEISQLVDNRIRLDTTRGQEYIGFLERVGDVEAYIETRVRGGAATIGIPLAEVDELKIRKSLMDRLTGDTDQPETEPQNP